MKRTEWDFLEKCTKEELIFFIKQNGFFCQYFRYSDVLSRRWQLKQKELMERQKKHHEKLMSIDTKKRDELAKQFNAEIDFQKRIKIAQKIKPFEDALKKWFEEEKELQKEEKKVEKLYSNLMAEYDRGRK